MERGEILGLKAAEEDRTLSAKEASVDLLHAR